MFVARTLNLPTINRTHPLSDFDSLNERRLVETLQRNKVAIDFEKNLETLCGSRDKFLNEFPVIKLFYQGLHAKIENDSSAFNKLRNEFSKEGIEFILTKSADSFPYESDNLDILIKPNELAKVAQTLRNTGYVELPQVREKHKFLFRKAGAYDELPLHIHTRVEWEGTQFMDSRDLWGRSKISDGDDGFSVPSPEDCILITAAHLFFENHEIKLDDLFKINSRIRNCSINWEYVFDHARRFHWNDTFRLTMLQLNQVYNQLYGRSMLPKSVLSKMEELKHDWSNLFRKIINPFSSGATPLKIPYTVVGLFFLRKVLSDSSSPLAERVEHVGLVACDVVKRKTTSSEKRALSMIDAWRRISAAKRFAQGKLEE
jgi:hypothetical protein